MVNAEREVLYCNEAMQNVISHRDALDVQDNRLVALRQEDDRKLDVLVRRVATGDLRRLTTKLHGARSSFAARRLRRCHPTGVERKRASRSVTNSSQRSRSRARVSRVPRSANSSVLTPTEAEIAARLADGDNISEIAAALDIRPGTVRVHLRSIYRKTRVSRQGELVRLVLCSIARFALR